jgi:hypothetical protein
VRVGGGRGGWDGDAVIDYAVTVGLFGRKKSNYQDEGKSSRMQGLEVEGKR